MTGERLAWHRIASHLRLTVEELKEKLTLTGFFDWLAFLDWEESRLRLDHHYLAQIAAEIRKTRAQHPKQVKLEHLLLKVVSENDRDRMAKSKAAWGALLGKNN